LSITASGVLQKPGDILMISEIELQKVLAGLLPAQGLLSGCPNAPQGCRLEWGRKGPPSA
jgi:hypothetical protein